ncbi:MAG: glycosyltransferase [Cyanobacteria bacterium P01_E01_bin.35]
MSRIVITTIGSLGDLHPKIAIALELRKRGHKLIFATHQEYQAKIEALGFKFYRIRPDNTALNDPDEMAQMMDLKRGTEYVIRNWICASLHETYADLISCCQDADLIIAGEGVIAARLVAEKLELPWVLVVLQPISFLSLYDPPVIPIFPQLSRLSKFASVINWGIIQLSKLITKSWADPVHQLRQKLQLPPLTGNPFIDDKYSPYLVLATFSSVLAKPQPDWAENTVITGCAFYDGSQENSQLAPELKQFLNAGSAPIIFTLGSAAVMSPGKFYLESIAAAKILNHRAVLLIGNNSSPSGLTSDIIAQDYAPYSQIFPYAKVIVHQGGIGTTTQALRAGCPTLIMPYSHDQPDNAARVKRLGTSRTITRKHYSARKVAQELNKLLTNPDYKTQATAVSKIIQAENGVQVACNAIEKQL